MNEIKNNKLVIRRRDGSVYYSRISKEDIPKIQKVKWFLFKTYRQVYIRSSMKYNGIFLHEYLIGKKKGFFVDHKNRDSLDNRRRNLRHVTVYQNGWNMKVRKDNVSGYKGVHFHKPTNKWNTRISVKGKRICLGHFEILEDAIKVRKLAEKKYHII
jgi:hypothetical protein